MPAASCRSMPARSISRCDTISASFGVSFRMGRKYRDNRMGTLAESFGRPEAASETGSDVKTQGEARVLAAARQRSASPAVAASQKPDVLTCKVDRRMHGSERTDKREDRQTQRNLDDAIAHKPPKHPPRRRACRPRGKPRRQPESVHCGDQ